MSTGSLIKNWNGVFSFYIIAISISFSQFKLRNNNYTNVYIEIDNLDNLEKLQQSIKEKGNSNIKISIKDQNKNYLFVTKQKQK